MGTIDIEKYVDEIIGDGKVFWDEERFTYEQFRSIVKKCVKEEADFEYELNDGEIDDWFYFGCNVVSACNRELGNDDECWE